MDGYEATRQIKAMAPDLPVIGQTAHAMAEEHAKCHEAGMVDLVIKPIELEALVQTIRRHVPGSAASRR
jgi:CheY-like chemotaxis protein